MTPPLTAGTFDDFNRLDKPVPLPRDSLDVARLLGGVG
jgi:hypothetical protein